MTAQQQTPTPDYGNTLLAVLQKQRNLAQDLLAKAETNVAMLEVDNARLAAENAVLRSNSPATEEEAKIKLVEDKD